MNRIITGRATGRRMTVGELRRFLDSIEETADDTPVRARITARRYLRSVTVEEKLKAGAAEDVIFGRERSDS